MKCCGAKYYLNLKLLLGSMTNMDYSKMELRPVTTRNVFVISDTHFGDEKMLSYLKADGSPARPEFKTVNEMDDFMVEQWNSVVRPCDKVYHLGDVAIKARNIHTLEKLNGDKVLVRGNHDTERLSLYRRYFRDVRAVHVHEGAILSHIPIHPDSMGRFEFNIHGHLHYNFVMRVDDTGGRIRSVRDNRYVNVCVEHFGYKPVLLSYVLETARAKSG